MTDNDKATWGWFKPEDTVKPCEWQGGSWQIFKKRILDDSLAHAWLLYGASGTGKRRFALGLSQYLLCDQYKERDSACGQCRGCQLNLAGNHPDLWRIQVQPHQHSQPFSRQQSPIKIDQIRALQEFLISTPHRSRYKIVLIHRLEELNVQASNALLKNLEEPNNHVVFLLISDQTSTVLPTIISRCVSLLLESPSEAQTLNWLNNQLPDPLKQQDFRDLHHLAPCAPYKAYHYVQSGQLKHYQSVQDDLIKLQSQQIGPIHLVKNWCENPSLREAMAELIDWLIASVWAIIQKKINGGGGDYLHSPDIQSLFLLRDKIVEAKRHWHSGANPNQQLLLEGIMIAWQDAQFAGDQVLKKNL